MNAVQTKHPVITHDDLIDLFRELKQTENGSRAQRKARSSLKRTFRTAIQEAGIIESWQLDMLQKLDELVDPKTGERVCPAGQIDNELKAAIGVAFVKERRSQTASRVLRTAQARA
jgi:hypothetical protein